MQFCIQFAVVDKILAKIGVPRSLCHNSASCSKQLRRLPSFPCSLPITQASCVKKIIIATLLTFVAVFDESLIDVHLLGVFQNVEETQVDGVRLFQDDVQQRFSGFDWAIF